MQFTRSVSLRLLKIVSISVITVLIIAYAIWRSLNYVRGPHIEIFAPTNGSTITTSSTIVHGQTARAENLTLNGRQIIVDQKGDFSETVALFPGQNILTLVATDQFGRNATTEIQLVGTVDVKPSNATSSSI